MKFYRLKNKKIGWGDYGSILLKGMTGYSERENGQLTYYRTGPFQPDLIVGFSELLATETTRGKLEASGLKGFSFRPVLKKHIVELDWKSWDLHADDPQFYPESGEPEDYILARPHSQALADAMEDVWEVVAQSNGTCRGTDNFYPGELDLDIMVADNRGYIFVTDTARRWIEAHCDGWVEFIEVKVGPIDEDSPKL